MRNFSLRAVIILSASILALSLSDCNKEKTSTERDYYVVDVKQDTDWDYWIIGNEGESFFIQLQNSIPTAIYYKPVTNKDGYTIFLDDKGIPSKAIVENHIFIFGNFRKSLMDISVILPDGEIKGLKDIQINYDFTSGLSKSQTSIQALNDAIKLSGKVIETVASCVNLAAAIPNGIVSIKSTVIGYYSLVSTIVENIPNNNEILGISSTTIESFATAVGCTNISDPTGAITCALAISSKGSVITKAAFQAVENKKGLISSAISQLKTGLLVTSRLIYITSTTATVGGNITFEGADAITERGVYYGLSENPETTGTKLQSGSGKGEFTTMISRISPGTTYYIKSYAINSQGIGYGSPVRFTTTSGLSEAVADIDNYVYNILKIGTQKWMAENLRTTKYNDGVKIPLVTDTYTWGRLQTPAYCWYNNDWATYGSIYGPLYNGHVVLTGKLCPTGWHVPSAEEWRKLCKYLMGDDQYYYAGSILKEAGTAHWLSPNTGTNESGFTALPGGCRNGGGLGTFGNDLGLWGLWWTSTIDGPGSGIVMSTIYMSNYPGSISENHQHAEWGMSVRCIKDN